MSNKNAPMSRPTIKIIIPKGTEIHSTHPTKSEIISRATLPVKNIYLKKDYLDWRNRVERAGVGGYWRWVDINDTILEANPELKSWIEEKKKRDE